MIFVRRSINMHNKTTKINLSQIYCLRLLSSYWHFSTWLDYFEHNIACISAISIIDLSKTRCVHVSFSLKRTPKFKIGGA